MTVKPVLATSIMAGDNAPRGARDGVVDAADLVVMERFVLALDTPDLEEARIADIAPVGAPDGKIDAADLAVLESIVIGNQILPNLEFGLQPPVLNSVVSPTNSNPYLISGSSQPGTQIVIYVNGQQQSLVTPNASGAFNYAAILLDGDNAIYAVATQNGDISTGSNVVTVNYINNLSRTIGGTLSGTVVWTPGATPEPYNVTNMLTLASGSRLIIQPGVKVIVSTYKSITISSGANLVINPGGTLEFLLPASGNSTSQIRVSGLLTVNGTNDSLVTFTRQADYVGTGKWNGIQVNAGGNVEINHAIIEHGVFGIAFNAGSSPELNPSHVYHTTFRFNGGGIPSAAVTVYGGSANKALNAMPIVNYCYFYNNARNYYAYETYVDAENVILDTRYNWWGSLDGYAITSSINSRTDSNAATNNMPNVDISPVLSSLAGDSYANVLMDNIYSEINGVYLVGEYRLLSGKSLNVLENSRLIVSASSVITIKAGAQMQIQAGSRLEFYPGSGKVVVNGELLVNGTPESPVVFTRSEASANKWTGISVNVGGLLTMDYAVVEYATNGVYFSGGNGSITHSLFRYNTVGLLIGSTSNPVVSQNVFVSNGNSITIAYSSASSPNPSIHNNNFNGDTAGHPIYLSAVNGNPTSPVTLDIKGNWWGTTPVTQSPVSGTVTNVTVDYSAALTEPVNIINPLVTSFSVSPGKFSPNGDGQLDTALFTATLSGLSNWALSISDNNGEVRRYSGQASIFSQAWDGRNNNGAIVNNGQYVAKLTATNVATGTTAGMQTTVKVDATAPVAVISSPLENAIVANDFDIIGSASDTSDFDNFKLEIGVYVNQALQRRTLNTSTGAVNNGILGREKNTNNWEDSSISVNGSRVIRLTVKDKSGNVTVAQRNVVLDNIEITNVSATNRVFHPLASQSSTINFTINRSANVTVRIYPELIVRNLYPNQTTESGVIKTLNLGQLAAGTHSVQWDGKNNASQYVADDVYIFMIEATDAQGGFDKYSPNPMTPNITVAYQADSYLTTEYIKQHFNPYKNQYLSYTMNTSNPARNPDQLPVRAGMSLLSSGKEYSNDFYKPYAASEFTAYIDGHTAEGQILPIQTQTTARLTGGFWTPINNSQVAPIPMVSGNGVNNYLRIVSPNYLWAQGTSVTVPVPSLKSDPYQLDLSYGQSLTEFAYSLDQQSDVTVKVLSPDLGHEWVLINNERQMAGDHSVLWDAIPSEIGAEPGHYTLRVTANHPVTGHGVSRHANITIYR